jgi:hypothetical protein
MQPGHQMESLLMARVVLAVRGRAGLSCLWTKMCPSFPLCLLTGAMATAGTGSLVDEAPASNNVHIWAVVAFVDSMNTFVHCLYCCHHAQQWWLLCDCDCLLLLVVCCAGNQTSCGSVGLARVPCGVFVFLARRIMGALPGHSATCRISTNENKFCVFDV